MKIEVKKDGKVFYHTENDDCMPSEDRLKSIQKAGYKVYADGKIWKPQTKKQKGND